MATSLYVSGRTTSSVVEERQRWNTQTRCLRGWGTVPGRNELAEHLRLVKSKRLKLFLVIAHPASIADAERVGKVADESSIKKTFSVKEDVMQYSRSLTVTRSALSSSERYNPSLGANVSRPSHPQPSILMFDDNVRSANEQFEAHVPYSDAAFLILKAHLVVEVRLLEFIKSRVSEKLFADLERPREGSFQVRLLLAQALADRDEIPPDNTEVLWPALEQLGKLRNDVSSHPGAQRYEARGQDAALHQDSRSIR